LGKASGKPAEVKFFKDVRLPAMFTPRGIAASKR
jgi:hypothetical protein